MKKLFLCFLFLILTSCDMDNGAHRNYIISQTKPDKPVEEIKEK